MPFLGFLAENIKIIYSREKSLKFCESMNIYQATGDGQAPVDYMLSKMLCCNGLCLLCADKDSQQLVAGGHEHRKLVITSTE